MSDLAPHSIDPFDYQPDIDVPAWRPKGVQEIIADLIDETVYAVLSEAQPDTFPVEVIVRVSGREVTAKIGGEVKPGDQLFVMSESECERFMAAMEDGSE